MRTKFIAGNWKMFKTTAEALEFADHFKRLFNGTGIKVAICAPYTQLAALASAFKGTAIKVGAQNMHYEKEGAFTGEISASMLLETGAEYCIIGHSERRQYFGETDDTCHKKLLRCFDAGILPILCVGEVLGERDAGKAFDVVERQIKASLSGLNEEQISALTVAYEPVWAIGTGRNATPGQANEMCGFIRRTISDLYSRELSEKVTIQYGGSVKPDNAAEILNMPEIDGALVGGASLKPETLLDIINYR